MISSAYLPNGWAVTSLGEAASYQNGRAFKPTEWKATGLPIIRIQNLNDSSASFNLSDERHEERFSVANGDLLFAWSASLGAHIWRGGKAWLNQHIFRVDHSPEIDRIFLYFALKNLVAELYAKAHGSGMVHVTKKRFEETPLWLPPFKEQRRIVDRIEALFDEIDRGVESLHDAKMAIKPYRQSLLKSAFEGCLTEDWRAENSDTLETPEVLLARIREERESRYGVALEDWERAIAEWKNGRENGRKPTKPKPPAGFDLLSTSECFPWPNVHVRALLGAPLVNGRSAKDREGGFPVLRLTALQSGKIDLRESKEGDWSEEDAEPFLVKRGDIFISRGNGSKKLVGKGGRVVHEPMPVAFPDTMIRVRPDINAVRPDYFLLAWNSWTVRQQIEKSARTTAGIYKINQGQVCGFLLPLPSLAEQSEIVRILDARLEAARSLESEIDANLARADALRQSILQQAFSGQLIPQDPTDEPASVLLARIRAERDTEPSKRSWRRTEA